MATNIRIKDGTDARSRAFSITLRTANPDRLLGLCEEVMPMLNIDENTNFINACMIAAVSTAKNLNDFFMAYGRPKMMRAIREYFWLKTRVDYPALNLIGHMTMAGGFGNTSTTINKFREQMGAKNIWICDIDNCQFKPETLRTIGTMALAFPYEKCRAVGRRIVQIYKEIDEIDLLNPSIPDTSHLSNNISKDNVFYKPTAEEIAMEEHNRKLKEKADAHMREIEEMIAREDAERERVAREERERIKAELKAKESREAAEKAIQAAKDAEIKLAAIERKRYVPEERSAVCINAEGPTKKLKVTERPFISPINISGREGLLSLMGKFFSKEALATIGDESLNAFASAVLSQTAINSEGIKCSEADSNKVSDKVSEEVSQKNTVEAAGCRELLNELADDLSEFGSFNTDDCGSAGEDEYCSADLAATSTEIQKGTFIFKASDYRERSVDEAEAVDCSGKRKLAEDSNGSLVGSVKKKLRRLSF